MHHRTLATLLLVLVVSGCAMPQRDFEFAEGYWWGSGAEAGPGFDTELRLKDFPATYIRRIHLDLTGPDHWMRLEWTGPRAAEQPTGPFRTSPGAGLGWNNCDAWDESNRDGSNCTPKGVHTVAGFDDYLRTVPECHYVTWVHLLRGIAIHYHPDVPDYAASHGCIRMDMYPARLIHNNSRAGLTQVHIGGTWSNPWEKIAAREARERAMAAATQPAESARVDE